MKKILLATSIGLLLTVIVNAQHTATITGNGKKVTRQVTVSPFDALKASGVYELQLTQGSKESVTIEADENLQDLIQVQNEGDQLVIAMKKLEGNNLKTKNKMKVYVTFRQLKSMELSTVGNVVTGGVLTFNDITVANKSVGHIDLSLTAHTLNLQNSSVGNVNLNGKAQNAVFKNSGVGTINAGNLVVQTMDIENTGVGGAEVNAEKELKVKDSFLGKVKNKGAAAVHKANRVVI